MTKATVCLVIRWSDVRAMYDVITATVLTICFSMTSLHGHVDSV